MEERLSRNVMATWWLFIIANHTNTESRIHIHTMHVRSDLFLSQTIINITYCTQNMVSSKHGKHCFVILHTIPQKQHHWNDMFDVHANYYCSHVYVHMWTVKWGTWSFAKHTIQWTLLTWCSSTIAVCLWMVLSKFVITFYRKPRQLIQKLQTNKYKLCIVNWKYWILSNKAIHICTYVLKYTDCHCQSADDLKCCKFW
jgi:hypothetical protein